MEHLELGAAATVITATIVVCVAIAVHKATQQHY